MIKVQKFIYPCSSKIFFSFTFFFVFLTLHTQQSGGSAFKKIKYSYKISDFENFVRKYPASSYTSLARKKIDSLREIYLFYDAIGSSDTLAFSKALKTLSNDSLKQELENYSISWKKWTEHKFYKDPSLLKNLYKIPISDLYATYGDTSYFIIIHLMLDKINVIRKKHARKKLEMNYKLSYEARRHAEEMCRRKFFNHQDLIRGNPMVRAMRANFQGSMVGENIAAGQTTIESLFESWMASKGHRANILNSKFNRAGMGFTICNAPGSKFSYYYVNLFGTEP
ncbi:MAG: CAP domain-containing protein [Bacteroidales bacterium]|nr:CAP domain-containing protein [Bacteroidales bacterium]